MATAAQRLSFNERRPDLLSGTPRAHAIDRWIYVFTAASFVLIILAGFIPDSVGKIHAVLTGQRPSFPLVLHMHAVLMASFIMSIIGVDHVQLASPGGSSSAGRTRPHTAHFRIAAAYSD